jgi:hypothetical protein
MPRRSAATATKPAAEATDFIFDPERIIPPSQIPPEHKDAYWTALMEGGTELIRAACVTENFFTLLREIPKSFWESRFFVYLYRKQPKVRNSDKERYIDRYSEPIDENTVKEEHGGGEYLAYLNMNGKEQLKQITFAIDGPPKLKPGQILVDANGAPLPTSQPTTGPQSEAAQSIEAASAATTAAVSIMERGTQGVIDMQNKLVERSLGLGNNQRDPIETAIRLLEVMRPAGAATPAPAADPMTAALTLMEKMETIIDKRIERIAPKDDTPRQDDETIFERGAAIVEKVTGKSLAQVMGKTAAAADTTPTWLTPVLAIASTFVQQLPNLLHQAAENRKTEFNRQVYLANLQRGNPTPMPNTPELPAPPAPAAPLQHQPQPATVDPGQLMNALVQHICAGFDKAPSGEWGEVTAASMDFQFSNLIESFGLDRTLCNPEEVRDFVAKHPDLAQRSKDARWKVFEDEFLAYCADRWGESPR